MSGQIQAAGALLKTLPETLQEGRLFVEKTFSQYLQKKEFDARDLASALWGSSASAWEIAKTLQHLVQSHKEVSAGTREIILKGIEVHRIVAEKASTPEERRYVCEEVAKLVHAATVEADKNRAFLLKGFGYAGGTIIALGGIVVFVRNPKLGTKLLATATKLFGR